MNWRQNAASKKTWGLGCVILVVKIKTVDTWLVSRERITAGTRRNNRKKGDICYLENICGAGQTKDARIILNEPRPNFPLLFRNSAFPFHRSMILPFLRVRLPGCTDRFPRLSVFFFEGGLFLHRSARYTCLYVQASLSTTSCVGTSSTAHWYRTLFWNKRSTSPNSEFLGGD